MTTTDTAQTIVVLARSLAEGVRDGHDTISDARQLERLIREAEGWLLAARGFLDPAETIR